MGLTASLSHSNLRTISL